MLQMCCVSKDSYCLRFVTHVRNELNVGVKSRIHGDMDLEVYLGACEKCITPILAQCSTSMQRQKTFEISELV